MQNIKTYLENLPGTDGNYDGAIGISVSKSTNPNHKSTARIETTRIEYFSNIFIIKLNNIENKVIVMIEF